MTYVELVEMLRVAKQDYVIAALERAVEQESEDLYRPKVSRGDFRTQSQFAAGKRHAEDQARDFYAEDITTAIADGVPALKPRDVFDYRRKTMAWAVASLIVGEGLLVR